MPTSARFATAEIGAPGFSRNTCRAASRIRASLSRASAFLPAPIGLLPIPHFTLAP